MRPLATIWRELGDADVQLLDVRQIRVTSAAVPGSPVTVPFAPERLRNLYLRAYPGETVDAELGATNRWRELLIYPDDWLDLLMDFNRREGVEINGTRVRIFGVPVVI